MKFGWPKDGEIVHCSPDKKNNISAHSPTLAYVRIVPIIYQGQRQTIYSECPKFHPNPFISGGVITERVNTVQMHHKVFPILGVAINSLPSMIIIITDPFTTQMCHYITFAKYVVYFWFMVTNAHVLLTYKHCITATNTFSSSAANWAHFVSRTRFFCSYSAFCLANSARTWFVRFSTSAA